MVLCGFVNKLVGKSAREALVDFEIGRSAGHWGGRGGICLLSGEVQVIWESQTAEAWAVV